MSLEDYLPMLTGGDMKFRPGARFSYSNGGFVLLGLAIEMVSGTPYHRFIQERVFEACDMGSSGFFRLDRLPARVATGYIEEGAGWRTNTDLLPIIGGPDGGAFSRVDAIDRIVEELTPPGTEAWEPWPPFA